MLSLYGTAYSKQNHTDKYKHHIESLTTKVFLAKDDSSADKRHNNREATYHRDDGYHRSIHIYGVVVTVVGERYKYRD